ncbi:MAG: protein arginine kinase [Candidatus Omnitrophica bacterium]|nr:protein arginine kinase [Candidatus Omnitrophota bacterium]
MKIDNLLYKESEWLKGTGPKANTVISSRIRLARNVDGYNFFTTASPETKRKIFDDIQAAVKKCKTLKGASLLSMKEITELDRQFLVERHLMSLEHVAEPESKGLVLDDKEVVSIMINEEDHLRIQVLQSGFNLTEAWRIIDAIDNDLAERLRFAFSPRYGFLTACPTNTGTGLRGSVMLHLPALAMTNQLNSVFQAISKLGLTIRGLYGEGTEATGEFYQISNQVTLGYSETDLIDNIEKIISRIIGRENTTRASLLSKNKEEITDKVWRAMGTLRSARIITSNETITLLSTIRLGIDLAIIKEPDVKVLNELFILMQPAHLQKLEGKALSPQERDVKRAALIREKLKS